MHVSVLAFKDIIVGSSRDGDVGGPVEKLEKLRTSACNPAVSKG